MKERKKDELKIINNRKLLTNELHWKKQTTFKRKNSC